MVEFEVAYLQECIENNGADYSVHGKMYPLNKSPILIGKDVDKDTEVRTPSLENKLVDPSQVSGIHATLVYEIEHDAWYVTNKSDFGTYFKAAHESEFKSINNQKQLLNNHDKIRLGGQLILEFMKLKTAG